MPIQKQQRKMWLDKALENLQALQKSSYGTAQEEETKRLVIEPLLAWAGYDVWEHGQIQEQYPIPKKGGQFADYAVMGPGSKPYIIIEAKALGKRLEDYFEQIIDYCNYSATRFGVITNGERWVLLDEQWKGVMAKDRKVLDININKNIWEHTGFEVLLLLNRHHQSQLEALIGNIRGIRLSRVSNPVKHIELEISSTLNEIVVPVYEEEKPSEKIEQAGEITINPSEAGEWPKYLPALRGGRRPDFVFLGNERFEIRSWRDIIFYTAEWLIKRKKLNENVKFNQLYIVNDSLEQPGSRIKHPAQFYKKLSNGRYLWVNLSADGCVEWSLRLLEHFGYSKDLLRPPKDWKPN